MKKILLFGLALAIGLAAVAQQNHMKSGIPSATYKVEQKVGVEPLKTTNFSPLAPKPSTLNNGDNPNIVSVITLGTSANAYGYSYGGGQKTMVWADDSLKALVNVHRMGPGTTPPSFSGYISVDLGVNMGVTSGDWTNNYQIYAATLNTGGTYYVDAGRYPQGGIYSPPGNTSPANAYAVYFIPNLSNTLSTWGGYSYGRTSLGTQSDSTKHLYWYAPPPYTYIPDGFTITNMGVTLATDLDQNWESGALVYESNVILHRGVWNTTNLDFDYSLNNLIPLVTLDGSRPAGTRVAASPDGNTVWVVSLGDNGTAGAIGGMQSWYPILFKSNDGGLTWSDPIGVQLDGPNGIPGIVQRMFTDYRLTQIFDPVPAREDISYTTAFDCDLVVDKWGNPHIGVVIGLTGSTAYSISTNTNPTDSLLAAYDVYSTDDGVTWQAIKMGTISAFRGTYGTITEDNRTNIAVTEAGDKVFVTWLDTQSGGVDNINPDVFARGFDLVLNKITSKNGNAGDNVTFLSDIYQQAYFECTSHYVFTDGSDVIVPICTELLSVPTDETQPVTFKYIPDFKYSPSDYTIDTGNDPFPVGVDNKKNDIASFTVVPNPVKDLARLSVNLSQSGNVSILVSNITGQTVLSLNKGQMDRGQHDFTLDATTLHTGVYFCTLIVDGQKITSKLIVE
jgi:hypothetical protein